MKSLYLSVFVVVFVFGNTLSAQTKKKSLFWEISGNGLKVSSYLYGTMHIKDKRVFKFKKGVLKAFNASETYVMELNTDSINQMEMMNKMWMDDDVSIKDLLTEEEYASVNKYFQDSLGQSVFLFNRMMPILTAQMLSLKDLSNDEEDALDLYFANLAKSKGMKVIGLETALEQMAALNAIPYQDQADMLYFTVMDAYKEDSDSEDMDKMIRSYLSGDLESLVDYSDVSAAWSDEVQEIFEAKLITERNKIMVDRMLPIIKTNKAFIAVGAAHLGGKKGVIQLLRDRGYTVEAK